MEEQKMAMIKGTGCKGTRAERESWRERVREGGREREVPRTDGRPRVRASDRRETAAALAHSAGTLATPKLTAR